jgi:adenylate cyclase
MKARHILPCTLGAAAVAVVLSILRPGPIARLDLVAYDELLRRSAPPPATGRVSIVAIDEKSIAEIGQWPWRRDVLARLVDRLDDLGAGVIAFDVLLSEPDRLAGERLAAANGRTRTSTTTDATLAAAFRRRSVVTSYAFMFDEQAHGSLRCALHPLQAIRLGAQEQASPARPPWLQPSGVLCSLPAFDEAAGASGFINVSVDRDGVVRRVPIVIEYQGQIYPSLALAAVQRSRGTRLVTLTTSSGSVSVGLAGQTIPLDAHGRLLLRFAAAGRTIPHLSASDVLGGRLPAGMLADQLVFVGATALGLGDRVATPLDATYPGLRVHAAVAENLLRNRFISPPRYPGVYELASSVAAALLVGLCTVAGGLLWASIGTAVSGILAWGLASSAFDPGGTFLSPVFPVLSATMSFAVLTLAAVAHERRRAELEKRRRQQAHRFIVQSLTSLTETRDVNTGRHARRTQAYTRLVATLLARSPRFQRTLTRDRIELMAILAPLHDIGKVGIPDAVLNKPGPLTPDEYAQMKTHPRLGYDAIANAESMSSIADDEIVGLAKEMVFTHHERWDGRGYPRGLAGDEIPIGGRILAVVDVYDALVSSRPYRVPMPHEQAVALIREQRGTHFDPDVVDAFVAAEHDIAALSKTLAA